MEDLWGDDNILCCNLVVDYMGVLTLKKFFVLYTYNWGMWYI